MNFYFTENKLINKMELISILKESRRMRRGGRHMLRRYGINDDAEFTQPLAEMLLLLTAWEEQPAPTKTLLLFHLPVRKKLFKE